MTERYAAVLTDWLVELGYTHCFFVAGGNSMHLLDAMRTRMTCIATVHEVAAGIAVEYFNESSPPHANQRALALVTAGPGLTNIVTAMAGAFLESRELLVIGGQVKRSDLARGEVRQRGIQEVDGIALAAPVCVATERVEQPIPRATIVELVERGRTGRPGPVFIEVCLDAQGTPVDRAELERAPAAGGSVTRTLDDPDDVAIRIAKEIDAAQRPVLLLGGGISRATAAALAAPLRHIGVPLMTTWNGMDRLGADHPLYAGRPNTWGQRAANVLLAQADLVVALGTRLGIQQTGFNWKEFAGTARVAQVELDRAELAKGHPEIALPFHSDANLVLMALADRSWDRDEWVAFCRRVRAVLPDVESTNVTADGYLSPYRFVAELAERCRPDDVVIPCSSGGAFTVTMQAFEQQAGQTVVTDKGLASMGYGLSGAIGAALANPGRRTLLLEGDGGFSQNLQELATVAVNDLDVKAFVFVNQGYASIRMTQRNYFGGDYLGCDTQTGLGFPDWATLFAAYRIPVHQVGTSWHEDDRFRERFEARGPVGFIVPIDPEQTYYPKISSRVDASGGMESNPLHLMSPDLEDEIAEEVFAYLPDTNPIPTRST